MELRPDGTVLYEGGKGTALPGDRRWRIARGEVERIAAKARAAGFFDLKSSLGGYGLDGSDMVVTICNDGQCRAVRAIPKRPQLLWDLHRDILQTSGAESYVLVTLATLDRLEAEGFDFQSERAGCLLARAVGYRQKDAALALITRGAPMAVKCDAGLGSGTPLRSASFDKDLTLLRELIARGAVGQATQPELINLIGHLESTGHDEAAGLLRQASGLTAGGSRRSRVGAPYMPEQNN